MIASVKLQDIDNTFFLRLAESLIQWMDQSRNPLYPLEDNNHLTPTLEALAESANAAAAEATQAYGSPRGEYTIGTPVGIKLAAAVNLATKTTRVA